MNEKKRIIEIINRIEQRTEKGDIKFLCAELVEKINHLNIKEGENARNHKEN